MIDLDKTKNVNLTNDEVNINIHEYRAIMLRMGISKSLTHLASNSVAYNILIAIRDADDAMLAKYSKDTTPDLDHSALAGLTVRNRK